MRSPNWRSAPNEMPSLLPKEGKALFWVQAGCMPKAPTSTASSHLEERKMGFKVLDFL
jgi:hypothetical protein